MRFLVSIFLLLTLAIGSFADSDKRCTYNEWSGSLVLQYQAHEPQKARGWAPTELRVCKDDEGLFAIVTHKAIGLGMLANPPLRIPKKLDEMKKEVEYAVVFNEGSSFDERNAHKMFDQPSVEAVIIFTGTKDQILVARKELRQVVSNTLFLAAEAPQDKK